MNYVLMADGSIISENALCHYGVKGQKWGIRRYQNKDGTLTYAGKRHRDQLEKHVDDIVIESGSRRSSVTVNPKLKLRGNWDIGTNLARYGVIAPRKRTLAEKKTYVYDDKDPHDKAVYEGAFSKYLQYKNGTAYIYKVNYKTVGDLVSPSSRRRAELFLESFKKTPMKYVKAMNNLVSSLERVSLNGNSNLSEALQKAMSKRITEQSSDKDILDIGYRQFNVLSEGKDRASVKAQNAYYKYLKKNGYNAILDDNNVDVYNEAKNPLIVLNAKKHLKKIDTERRSPDDVDKTVEELRDRLEKIRGEGKRKITL